MVSSEDGTFQTTPRATTHKFGFVYNVLNGIRNQWDGKTRPQLFSADKPQLSMSVTSLPSLRYSLETHPCAMCNEYLIFGFKSQMVICLPHPVAPMMMSAYSYPLNADIIEYEGAQCSTTVQLLLLQDVSQPIHHPAD